MQELLDEKAYLEAHKEGYEKAREKLMSDDPLISKIGGLELTCLDNGGTLEKADKGKLYAAHIQLQERQRKEMET